MSSYHKLEGSINTIPSEALIFNNVFQETGIERIETVELQPANTLSDNAPIDFILDGLGSFYVDTRKTKIKFSFKIVAANGDDLPEAEPVTSTNMTVASAFSQVDVFFNQKLVSTSGQNYAYKAIMDTLLHYGSDAKLSQLQNSLYYKTSGFAFDSLDPVLPSLPINLGMISRYQLTKGSTETEVLGQLFCDSLMLDKWLLNSVSVRIRLWPAKDSFRLVSSLDNGYKMKITKAILEVCKVHVSSGIIASHGSLLKKELATYPYTRSEMRVFTVGTGHHSAVFTDLFQREIPSKMVIGFVSGIAYDGLLTQDPFQFQTFRVNFIGLSLGNLYLPHVPLTPYFSANGDGQYCSNYNSLFTFANKLDRDTGLDISRAEYPGGYGLTVFDINSSAKQNSSNTLPLQQTGDLKLELRFTDPLPYPIVVICYGLFPGVIEIDEPRNVIIS
jgi:hypothetical protein